MRKRAARGFTLLELVVVILVIGVLAAVVPPLLLRSHDDGHARIQCVNNQKQLALGFHTHVDLHGRLPGYWSPPPKSAPQGSPPQTWVAAILPEIEQQALYDQFWGPDAGQGLDEADIPIIPSLLCPFDRAKRKILGANNYVVNCGRADGFAPRTADEATAAAGPPDWRGNGLFTLQLPRELTEANAFLEQSKSFFPIVDGVSNTILLSENIQSGAWYIAPEIDEAGWPLETERAVGIVWFPELDSWRKSRPARPVRQINAGSDRILTGADQRLNLDFARPSADHGRGVNMAFADASVRFISDKIDYRVYCQLMTSDSSRLGEPGGEAGPPAGAPWVAAPIDRDALP